MKSITVLQNKSEHDIAFTQASKHKGYADTLARKVASVGSETSWTHMCMGNKY